jgi:hypothetical protein
MDNQLNLFEKTGQQLRDEGMQKAEDNANQKTPEWSWYAYKFLLSFIRNHNTFMVEEVRESAKGIIPEPPSKRAWGGIVVRAAKNGFIERAGYGKVKNPKAHCTPATLWRVKNV